MNSEQMLLFPAEESNLLQSDEFDLSSFFEQAAEDDGDVVENELMADSSLPLNNINSEPIPDLLVVLRDDANESIATITSKVTADTFATGAALTASVFSVLGSIVGSCGVVCAHSLASLGQLGSGMSGASGLAGMNMPGFSVDKLGNYVLEGNINSLSKATGISSSDLLSGRFSAQDILAAVFSVFGESLSLVFGFGLVETLIGYVFDGFIPKASSTNELSSAA